MGWVGLGWVVQMLVDWWIGLTERGVRSSWFMKERSRDDVWTWAGPFSLHNSI